jgi:hypothetical protein
MTPQNDGLHMRPYKDHSSFFPEMPKNRLDDPSLWAMSPTRQKTQMRGKHLFERRKKSL